MSWKSFWPKRIALSGQKLIKHSFEKGATFQSFCLFSTHNKTPSTAFVSRSTIFALSSGAGKAGVAVIRISGPCSTKALKRILGEEWKETSLFFRKNSVLPAARTVAFRRLFDPRSGEKIDDGLVVRFEKPASFTGEDVVELNIHGGIAVVKCMLRVLGEIPGLRAASAGEFTRRAYFNLKLDLTRVEGLSDLINAETEVQRKQALSQMSGEMSVVYENWRQELLRIVAEREAFLDFGDSEGLDEDSHEGFHQVLARVGSMKQSMEKYLSDNRRGEIRRNGVNITIAGLPNVGKSTLLNLLSRREVAIVSDVAGTTRDVIEVSLDLGGCAVILRDTAGIRYEGETQDQIELEGVKRAVRCLQEGDVKVLVFDSRDFHFLAQKRPFDTFHATFTSLLHSFPSYSGDNQSTTKQPVLLVFNKIDLLLFDSSCSVKDLKARIDNFFQLKYPDQRFYSSLVSCKTGLGMDDLVKTLTEIAQTLCETKSTEGLFAPIITQTRHRENLTHCVEMLQSFLDMNSDQNESHQPKVTDECLQVEELRRAIQYLGKITGRTGVEDILDVIFKEFCIGK